MKRSDMLIKIHEELIGQRSDVNFAQVILDAVEKCGMKPPFVTEGYEKHGGNIWEPENE